MDALEKETPHKFDLKNLNSKPDSIYRTVSNTFFLTFNYFLKATFLSLKFNLISLGINLQGLKSVKIIHSEDCIKQDYACNLSSNNGM